MLLCYKFREFADRVRGPYITIASGEFNSSKGPVRVLFKMDRYGQRRIKTKPIKWNYKKRGDPMEVLPSYLKYEPLFKKHLNEYGFHVSDIPYVFGIPRGYRMLGYKEQIKRKSFQKPLTAMFGIGDPTANYTLIPVRVYYFANSHGGRMVCFVRPGKIKERINIPEGSFYKQSTKDWLAFKISTNTLRQKIAEYYRSKQHQYSGTKRTRTEARPAAPPSP